MHVGRGYGDYWRGIIFRQTYKQLADLVVKTQRLFYNIFPGARFNKSDYVWHFPDGEQLLLRQMRTEDDYWDYHGHEYPFIGWEELTAWKTLGCYDIMKSCWRSPRQGMPRIYASTTNPFGIGHRAVKERFITPGPRGTILTDERGNRRIAIHGNVRENRYLLKADPDYVARLAAIRDPNVRKAWLDGSWDINAGGAVDDVWNEKVHMIPQFKIPAHWKITRSFDWGSARPFSVGWHVKSDGTPIEMPDGSGRVFTPGTKIRVDELYGSSGVPNEGLKWTNRRIAQEIRMREERNGWKEGRVRPGGADSAIYDRSNGWDKSVADEMEKEQVYFLPAPKGPGSRRRRLDFLRTGLDAGLPLLEGKLQEKPGIFVMNNCKEYRRQIPDLPRDPEDYECVDSGGEDHLYDEHTYELSIESETFTSMSL